MDKVEIGNTEAVDKAIHALDEGGIVMHPTETCYGFAVDIFHEDALKKLYYVKDMKLDKPVSIMVDGLEMAQEYGEFSKKALELAKKYWPGPLSIVVPRKDTLPPHFNKGQDFVSIRVPEHDFSLELAETFGQPLTTTSANKTGDPQLYRPEVMGGIDLIVDGGRLPERAPTTIVKVDGAKVEILRHGELSI